MLLRCINFTLLHKLCTLLHGRDVMGLWLKCFLDQVEPQKINSVKKVKLNFIIEAIMLILRKDPSSFCIHTMIKDLSTNIVTLKIFLSDCF